MASGYERLLSAMTRFRNHEIDFDEFSQWVRGYASSIGENLCYKTKGDFYFTIDNWLEYIEYCYPESDRYELACSLALFLEKAILEETKPLQLPLTDRVVRERGLGRRQG